MIRIYRKSKIILFQLFIVQSFLTSQQIIITEIMYDLVGSDSPSEFVELFNPSETDTINLEGWFIQDRSSTDALIDSGYGLKIPPLSYGLIMEGDYIFETGIYNSIILENTILIKVDDSSIGNGLSASDSLFLLDSSGQIIETIGWEDWVQDGYSLERIRYHIDNNPSNWAQSIDSLGTPGSVNSILPDSIDFSLRNIFVSPEVVSLNQSTTLFGSVVNVGLNTAEPEIMVYVDGNYYTNEFLGNILELDTTDFELEIGPFESGNHTILVSLNALGDINTNNNQDSTLLGVRYEFRTFILNEFVPKPATDMPEFVEIVNISPNAINLNNWRITDSNEGTNYGLGSVTILANEYAVIAADSSSVDLIPNGIAYIVSNGGFPTLNNGGDKIRIFDPFNTLIDSLTYTSAWGISQGVSIEKYYIHDSSHVQENWAPSTSPLGFTVGSLNSVTPATTNGTLLNDEITYSPEIPSESENVSILVPILNSGISIFSGTVQVYSNNSLLNQTHLTSGNLGDTVLVNISLGTFSAGFHELSIVLSVENDASEVDNTGLNTLKIRYPFGTILINEFMSAPNNDQSEFVELMSFQDIDLINWEMSDNQKNPVQLDTLSVALGDFIVILSDSNMISQVDANAHINIPSNFPSLNNSADGIYLYDHTGSIIDSLIYDNAWDLVSEKSSEKKRPSYLSNNANNWDVADNDIGFTLGFQNSIMILDVDGMILQDSIKYSPIPPYADAIITIQIPIVNVGVSPFNGTVSIEINDDEVEELIFEQIEIGDTLIIEPGIIAPSSGISNVTIILDILDDGNSENDIATFPLPVRFPFGTILINELFPLPDSTESEFVEIIPQDNVNILNWGIMDLGSSIKHFPDINLKQYAYCVITSDSFFSIPDSSILILPEGGLPALNNTSETIFLVDHTGSIIDSVHYNENWHLLNSRSMEKYRLQDESNNLKNWGISVGDAGKTPGIQNSLFFSILPSKGNVELSPNPFSPDGDGIDDELILLYSIPFNEAIIRWEIFDMAGRIIAKPYYNYQIGQNGKLTWNGLREFGKPARIGIYIMKISFLDMSSNKSWESIKTIVLAKPL